MINGYADLHVHSYYSDGSMSPEEIVLAALENGVGLLAVADHDLIKGSLEVRGLCEKNGITWIPAVEINSLDGKSNFHILAYGFDTENVEFIDFLGHSRFLLDESSVKLIEAMGRDYGCVSLDDYWDYEYDKRLGGWKALHYLMSKGITGSLEEGIGCYHRYGMTYEKAGYSTIGAITRRIKKAGGRSVLAHPGELIDSSDMGAFRKELSRIMAQGLDGIECYYPTHSGEVTAACVDYCRRNGLMITSGSDCHGLFGKTRVGEMKMPIASLEIRPILKSF